MDGSEADGQNGGSGFVRKVLNMNKESKRVLIVATVVKTHIMQFHIPTLKLFKDMGWETAVAARNDYEEPEACQIPYCDHFYDIPFERCPFKPQNIQCYKKLKGIIDHGNFQIVHCHTPVGGVLGRLAARKARKNGTRVLYTAHGFHFFHGASVLNWLLFYPIESICANFADAILTINQEDCSIAKKRFKSTRVYYLPGIGVDVAKYGQKNGHGADAFSAFGIGKDTKRILSVGELNDNKNHKTIIKALTYPQLENVHYFIAGDGHRRLLLEEYATSLQVGDRVHFLGFRDDVASLLHASDVFVFPSFREGLPVSVLEAMAAGVPVVASKIRGNEDLIEDGINGFLCDPQDVEVFVERINQLLSQLDLTEQFRIQSLEKIKEYDKNIVIDRLSEIYHEVMKNEKCGCSTPN